MAAAANVGEVNVALNAESSLFVKGMKTAAKGAGVVGKAARVAGKGVQLMRGGLKKAGVSAHGLRKGISLAAAGMKKAHKAAVKLSKGLEKGLAKFKKIGAAAGAAGAAVMAGLAVMVRGQLGAIDAQAKMADRLGITNEALAETTFVAGQFGIEQSKVSDMMKDLTERIADAAANGGSYGEALDRIGLSANQLIALPVDQQFNKVIEAMGGLTTQSDKVFVGMELMADAGFAAVNMADAGAESLQDMREEAARLNISVSRVDASKVEEANRSLKKAKAISQTFSQQLTVGMAPLIEAVSSGFVDWAAGIGGFGGLADKVLRFTVRGVGKVMDAWHGLNMAYEAGRKGLAMVSLKTHEFVRNVVIGFNYIKGNIGGAWDWIKAKADVLFTKLGLMNDNWSEAFTYSLASIKEAFGETVMSMGQLAISSNLKGLTDIGTEAVHAGFDVWNAAQEQKKASAKILFDGSEELKEAQAALVEAERSLIDNVDVNSLQTPVLDEKIATLKSVVEEAQANYNNLAHTEEEQRTSGLFEAEVGRLQAESQLRAAAHAEKAAKNQEDRSAELEELRKHNEDKAAEKLAADLADQQRQDRSINFMTAAWREGLEAQKKFTKMHWSEQAKTIFGEMQNITNGTAKTNKTMFKINKIAALANAGMNTASGVSKTLSAYPYPWNIPMAGLHLAAGVAQVRSISASSYGGGSGASSVPSSSVSVPAMAGSADSVVGTEKPESIEPDRYLMSARSDFDVLSGMQHMQAIRNGSLNANNSPLSSVSEVPTDSARPFSEARAVAADVVLGESERFGTLVVNPSDGDGVVSSRWVADKFNEAVEQGHPITRILHSV